MRTSGRLDRFLSVSSLAARVYLGYKAISLAETRLGLKDAEARRSQHHTWAARRLYDLAVRRQGLLIKFGQAIGSRPDLIPDEYIGILSRLQDQVPPKPFRLIERHITRELGRPLADVFADFDTAPVAAASLAQVHHARLKDGRDVAVKVQYPGIWDIVHTDLQSIRTLLRILSVLERNLDFTPIIQEISRNVPLELDFINEGHNAEIIARNFAARDDIIVPGIIWEYTTRRLLVMEYLEGVKITDVEGMHRQGIEPQAVAQLVTDAYCEQLFLHGMFHADPHPGNFFVLPGPKLIMLDFGLCRQLDDQFRLGYAKLVNAMLTWNPDEMVQAFHDLGFRVRRSDDPTPYLVIGRAFMQTSVPGRAYADRDLVAEANTRVARAVRSNPFVEIPREFLLIMRVTGLLSGLGKHLDSRVDVISTLLPYTRAALEGAS
ncbi:MAG: AarF/ABC1/UbiB kinase family protein [Chloroflexi bacterium]|nr:AarF/ABC1/UbiB kinase family protein [Chloroflexota bacterium]